MTNKPVKDITHYLSLPYTILLRRDEDGDVVARIEELPGCLSHGSDEIEALKNLREMQRLWIEDCIETGQPIPEPQRDEPLPSGKWVQRVPRRLHRRLTEMARTEGVSLNQLVTSMLAEQISVRTIQRSLDHFLSFHAAKQQRPGHYWDHLMQFAPGGWVGSSDPCDAVRPRHLMMKVIADTLEVKVPYARKKSEEDYFYASPGR